MTRCLLSAVVVVTLVPWHDAHGHIVITSHESRYGDTEIKDPPCGLAGGGPGDQVYTYTPGETIVIEWDEFVDHPGHFRISFDDDGDDDFVDPAGFDDLYSNDTVLIDGIPDMMGGIYSQEVQLPDVECDHCTIQVIQVMTDKPPYGDGNDLYYGCIDVALVPDGGDTGDTSDGASETETTEESSDTGDSDDTGTTVETGEGTSEGSATDEGTDDPDTVTDTDSTTGNASGPPSGGCSCAVSDARHPGGSLFLWMALVTRRRRLRPSAAPR